MQEAISTSAAEVIIGTSDATDDDKVANNHIEQEIVGEQLLQPGTVVHLQQQLDSSGKIQVIPVMLSLPDLTNQVGMI